MVTPATVELVLAIGYNDVNLTFVYCTPSFRYTPENFKYKYIYPMFHVCDLQPAPKIRTRFTADSSSWTQPPEVPMRNHVAQKQNLVCSRTATVAESSPTPLATEKTLSANIQPMKFQELKPLVVTNLKSLKKKLQKKMSNPQENVYAEITKGPDHGNEVMENEYQEIKGELTFGGSPQYHTDVRLNNQMLPQEYRSPPPFAPGY